MSVATLACCIRTEHLLDVKFQSSYWMLMSSFLMRPVWLQGRYLEQKGNNYICACIMIIEGES